MSRQRILTTFLLLALASSAWGAISITSSNPPSPITIGQGYTFQISASSAANFAVTAGALPAGMTLASGGLLSATQVTATGTFNFTVTATSTSNTADTVAVPYSIVVNNGPPTVNRSSFNPKAAVGAAYSSQLTGLGGNPSPSYSWSLAPGNNDGISISTTGLLSGTPVSSGVVPLNVQISDGVAFGSVVLQLNVIGIDTTTLPNGSVGTAYSQQLVVSGAVGSVTWAIAGINGLPPGLSLSSNGIISGTPTTNGSYPFAISATDSTGNIATANFTITIGATFTITTTTLPNATVGVAYSQALAASGGVIASGEPNVAGRGVRAPGTLLAA
mgnify:CR=1 FL=1